MIRSKRTEDASRRLRHATARLRAAEAKYRLLVEHIPAIAYIQDVDHTNSVHYVSPQVEAILGYSAEECTNVPGFFINRIHPDDREAAAAEDRRTNQTGEPFRMEYRLLTQDGRYVWVRDEAILVRDEIGAPKLWQGILFDITARKQTETSLRLAMGAAQMGTWDWELATGHLTWSEESEALHGLPPGTFAGTYDAFLTGVHPDDRPKVDAAVTKALTSGEDYETEYRVVTPDGAVSWEYVKGKVIRDAAGNAVRMMGVGVDITARRQAEEEIRFNEERFRALVQNAADIIGIVEADATVRYISPAVERILGIPAEEIVGAKSFAFHHPEDTDRAHASFVEAIGRPGESVTFEMRARHAGGSWRWLEVTVTNHLTVPGLQGLVVNARDITDRRRDEEEIRFNEERFRSLVQRAADVIVILEADGLIRYVSPAIEPLLGYRPEDVTGILSFNLAHPDDLERIAPVFAKALSKPGETTSLEARARHLDGSWRWVDITITNHLGVPGIDGLVVNARDVTDRRYAEEQLREAETRYRNLVEQIAAVIYVDDVEAGGEDRATRYISPQIEAMLGYTAAEWVADRTLWAARLHPDDRYRIMAEVARTSQSGDPFRVEYRLLDRNGRVVWVRDEAIPVHDVTGRPVSWHGLLHDVTERKALEAQLAHQAFHDALTGLPNRALFNDRLDHALRSAVRHGEPVAVLFLDLDRFKMVNDSLGHEAGDRLLIEAGERFTACLRAGDTIARLGGDEFAILLEGATVEEAQRAADRVMSELHVPFRLAGQEVFATASVGIALNSPERATPSELLRAADLALYQAKRVGRATSVPYEPGLAIPSASWIALESDLRRAIERNELLLYFQPIVDLTTGAVRTLEALLRWDHPLRGLVAPAEFLPLAEETGLIAGIGLWALEEACRQFRFWQVTYPGEIPQTINVNLTARQLRDPALVLHVDRALAAADLDPSSLRLEIVEEALVEDLRATAGTLRALRELGVRLAIDDFGAGASSLASFRELSADVLKLDRSFIRPLGNGAAEDEAVVAAIAALGHRLGMRVTAEGIETEEQLAAVRRAGCDSGQGYLLGRSVPADRVPGLLRLAGAALLPPVGNGQVVPSENGVDRSVKALAV